MSNYKISYPHGDDPSARCTNCEMPATPDNPIVVIKREGVKPVLSHINCPSAKDKAKEVQELQARNASLWSFAAVNKFVPPQPEQSTNQETFPSPKTHKVTPMTRTIAAPEYEDGSIPVPPQN